MSALEHIRAVIFDLFHTLVSLEVSRAPGRGTAEIFGIDPEVWYRHWLKDPDDYVLGLAPVEVPIRRLAKTINPTVTEEQIQEVLKTRHERFRHTLLNVEGETLDDLRQLRQKGFKLGLISNCGIDEIAHWQESPLAPLFDTVLFSCFVRLKKPDPAIYRLAAEKLNFPPSECLYVGNGGSDEFAGALSADMTPVLLTHHLEAINPNRIIGVISEVKIAVRTVNDLLLFLNLKP